MVDVGSTSGLVSTQYLQSLSKPHQIVVRADAYRGGVLTHYDLPVMEGSIFVSQRSVVRRTCNLVIGGELRKDAWDSKSSTPLDADHELSHHGQEIRIRHGMVFPDGSTEWVQVGRFRIESHSGADLLGRGPVSIQGLSYEAYVEEARFTKPRTVTSTSAVSLIVDLIKEVLPQAQFRVGTQNDRRVPKTTFDRDRWSAIETLATSIGAIVYTDGAGIWCIDPAVTSRTPSTWRLAPGTGGTLVTAQSSGGRDQVYNEAVVTNDNATTDVPPVFATARDDNPLSPTRWGDPDAGAFGKVTTFLEIPTLTTEVQGQEAANALLGRSIGRSEQFTLTGVPIAPMEAGDVVDVVSWTDNPKQPKTIRHIVDEYTLPLKAGGEFRVSTRNIGEA